MPTWGEVKNKVERLREPTDTQLLAVKPVPEGRHGKEPHQHSLMKYEYVVEATPTKYSIMFKYAYCPECKSIRWKKFSAYNEPHNLCYERILWKGGEPVEIKKALGA